jgi:hypothetical protein
VIPLKGARGTVRVTGLKPGRDGRMPPTVKTHRGPLGVIVEAEAGLTAVVVRLEPDQHGRVAGRITCTRNDAEFFTYDIAPEGSVFEQALLAGIARDERLERWNEGRPARPQGRAAPGERPPAAPRSADGDLA